MTPFFDQLSQNFKNSGRFDQGHWLTSYRTRAWEAFNAHGLPDRSWEDWRYLSLRSLKELPPPAAPTPQQQFDKTRAAWLIKTLEEKGLLSEKKPQNQVLIICLNGQYLPLGVTNTNGAPEGLAIDSLAALDPVQYADFEKNFKNHGPEKQAEKHQSKTPFYQLNSAFITDGLFVTVSKNHETIEQAIHVVHLMGHPGFGGAPVSDHTAACSVYFPRLAIRIEAGAKVALTETYLGLESKAANPYLCIPVTQVLLEDGAHLDHVRIQQDTPQGMHIGSTQKALRAASQLKSFSLSSHGPLVRHDLHISLQDQLAHAAFDGLFLVKGSQLVDHHTTVDHRVPNTQSRQIYHGIVSDHGRGIFNGKVLVRPGAHGTDARQTNKNLILSSDAEIDTKPELQIDADDVKCSHGAAVGQMDPDHLFYLQARGIPEATARKMLLQAFAHDCLERFPISNKTLASWVSHQVMEYFAS